MKIPVIQFPVPKENIPAVILELKKVIAQYQRDGRILQDLIVAVQKCCDHLGWDRSGACKTCGYYEYSD